MQRIPSSASNFLLSIVSIGVAIGGGILFYERYVNGNPMRIFRDGEGVLRFETRMDVVQRRYAEANAKYLLDPESKQAKFELGVCWYLYYMTGIFFYSSFYFSFSFSLFSFLACTI